MSLEGADAKAQRKIRRPAYFSPARRRPLISSQASAASAMTLTGGSRIASAASSSEAPSA
jgi:hypothetical protein